MRRTQIYLDELQAEELARRAAAAGRTKSDLIREAIEAYLARDDESARLARFREAVRRAAGIAPYLPDGASYVEAIRRPGRARHEP